MPIDGFVRRTSEQRDIQIVAITGVDPITKIAKGLSTFGTTLDIDCRYPVGGMYILPDKGDQWYVDRMDMQWRLSSRIPFNDNNTTLEAVPGQQIIGGTGPVVLNGSQVDIIGPANISGPLTVGDVLLQDVDGKLQQSTDGGETFEPIAGGGGDVPEGLQEILDGKLDGNDPITAETHTKITYDEKGLVTFGEDAEIVDITGLETALAGKAAFDHVHDGGTGAALDPDLVDIGALTPDNSDFIQRVSDHWTNISPSQAKLAMDLSFLDIGGILEMIQIPGLDASKITGGIFGGGLIPNLDASKIISGEFLTDLIPGLDASQITGGIFGGGLIPNLDASKIVSGIFGGGQIPNLDASKIVSGEFLTDLIPFLDAGQITSGIFGGGQIPTLDASKIISGQFLTDLIPGLDTSHILGLDDILGGTANLNDIVAALTGGPKVGFSAVGNGIPVTNANTMTFAHTQVAGDHPIIWVPVTVATNVGYSSFTTRSATYAGVPMFSAGAVNSNNGTAGFIELFYLQNPPEGTPVIPVATNNVVVTMVPPAGTCDVLIGNAVSYLNVEDFEEPIIGYRDGTGAPSVLVPSNTRAMVLGAFASGGPISTPTDTQRYLSNVSSAYGAGNMLIQDQVGETSAVLGAANNSDWWGYIGVSMTAAGGDTGDLTDWSNLLPMLTGGLLSGGVIPGLDASKIISGIFPSIQIPNLDAAKIISGEFITDLIPDLDASKIVSGALDLLRIPFLPAELITSGIFDGGLIPTLDASKIISGEFLADLIPFLDASKIGSGTFLTSLIPSLDAGKIISGVFGGSQIPTLDASKIISGTFITDLIPFLDASRITSGVFGGGLIPTLDASKIGSGQFGQSMISGLENTLGFKLNWNDPLNALNLYNHVPTDLLAQIPVGIIGDTITNLISDPYFQDASQFIGGGTWIHDAIVGHVGMGSARTTADGSTRELLTSNPMVVSEGQVLNLSGWVKWTGLVGTGLPIALAVTGYIPGGATDQKRIAERAATPTTTDWTQLSGTYTVPPNVTSLRVRLVVSALATAGTVWWDDLSATKIQSMFQRFIQGTDPGTTITNDIEGLFSGVMTNAIGLTNKAGLSDFNSLVSTIGGDIQEGFEDIGDRLNTFLHGGSILNAGQIGEGQVGDQYVPGLSTIHDAIVTAVGALSGSGFDVGKMLEVLRGQTHAVVDNSAGIIGMFSRLGHAESKLAALPVSLGGTGVGISYGGIVGSSDTDEFERVSSISLGAQWLQYYSSGGGVWATPNGHDAEYMWSGTSDREFICIRNNPALLRSLTDYQRVTNVLSSKGTRHYDAILGTYDYAGHNDVWLRISDATTSLANVTGIRIRWGADGSLSIVRFVNGIATTLKSFGIGAITPPGPGAQLIGEAGDMNGGEIGKRYFRGIIGNSIRIEVTETGTASGFGAAYRRWGHGGRVEGWVQLFDNGQERPGALHHWNAMDQVFA